ncbi:hypothetical protein Golomagni_02974 [Golovinomyces magnicellulatus]|nr:hypothetical protein Golomagni_02974 [Golovinomyces magnicellulatus]
MTENWVYSLPEIPYGYDALEPHISGQIMRLHHSKHHQAYVTNLNNALELQQKAIKSNDIVTQLQLQQAISFNAGGNINHTLFWESLVPASSPLAQNAAAPNLMAKINTCWSSFDLFKEKFAAVLLNIKGSGWGWLVQDKITGGLSLIATKDQEIVPTGQKPLLGIDLWEHAYYLQYLNDKATYVKEIWNVINWAQVEQRFLDESVIYRGIRKERRSEL